MTNLIDNAIGNTKKTVGQGVQNAGKFIYKSVKTVGNNLANFLNQSGSLGNNTYKGTQNQRDFWKK